MTAYIGMKFSMYTDLTHIKTIIVRDGVIRFIWFQGFFILCEVVHTVDWTYLHENYNPCSNCYTYILIFIYTERYGIKCNWLNLYGILIALWNRLKCNAKIFI